MGFPEVYIPHAARTVAKHQFGNAVVPPLFRHVAAAVLEARARMEEELKLANHSMPLVIETELARLKNEFHSIVSECDALTIDAARKGQLAVEKAYHAGEILWSIKAIVGHGHFEDWKKTNLNCSTVQAWKFMILHSHINDQYGDILTGVNKHADGWSVEAVVREFKEERRINRQVETQCEHPTYRNSVERDVDSNEGDGIVADDDVNTPASGVLPVDGFSATDTENADDVSDQDSNPEELIKGSTLASAETASEKEWMQTAEFLEILTGRVRPPKNRVMEHCDRMKSITDEMFFLENHTDSE